MVAPPLHPIQQEIESVAGCLEHHLVISSEVGNNLNPSAVGGIGPVQLAQCWGF
jgi:hypothetical protein